MQPAPKVDKITYTDEVEKHHQTQIAKHTSLATSSNVELSDVQPKMMHNPLPQFVHPSNEKLEEKKNSSSDKMQDSELLDIFEGWQGKPRTAPALDFLKDKLSWMKKKHGEDVTLIRK